MSITHKRRAGLEYVDRNVGAVVRRVRMALGMSQELLGDKLGITFQQVQKYEHGANAVPSTRIPSVCKILGISPNELFGWTKGGKEDSAEWSVAAVKLAMEFDQLSPELRGSVTNLVRSLRNHQE